jgi:hypothetical protein
LTQDLRDVVRDLIIKVDSLMTQNKMLETQITQKASSSRALGKLPSQPEPNPREQHIKALTLRSGKQIGDSSLTAQPETLESVPVNQDAGNTNPDASNTKDDAGDNDKTVGRSEEPKYMIPSKYRPPLPFPQRVVHAKLDK